MRLEVTVTLYFGGIYNRTRPMGTDGIAFGGPEHEAALQNQEL
jgi:hypothetical protein